MQSISAALETEMASHGVALSGGFLVAQVTMAAGETLRARDGWTLELCESCVRVSRIGWGDRFATVALAALVHAGDETATADEIDAARQMDELKRAA